MNTWVLLIIISAYDGRITSQQIQNINSQNQCNAIFRALKKQYSKEPSIVRWSEFTCVNTMGVK